MRPEPASYDTWEEWAAALLVELASAEAKAPKVEPTGKIAEFYGTTVGAGYLPCVGGSFSTTAYPNLALLLGGSTLPNLTPQYPGCVVGIKV